MSAEDAAHMSEALALAARGMYSSTPNPNVGCVLVLGGRVIGRGYHARAGGLHAEAVALADARAAGEDPLGATAYVTLEPCAHFGRTPPCADALIEARVARVVAALRDPDVRVAGAGFARLRAAGIAVEVGLCAAQARALHAGYIKRQEQGRPLVRIKLAMSLDGRTAMASGESRWITGAAARQDVQHWRARSCAIVTGAGTVLADDPQLSVRDVPGTPPPYRQPLRVVLDRRARVPATAQIMRTATTAGPVLWLAAGAAPLNPPAGVEWLTRTSPARCLACSMSSAGAAVTRFWWSPVPCWRERLSRRVCGMNCSSTSRRSCWATGAGRCYCCRSGACATHSISSSSINSVLATTCACISVRLTFIPKETITHAYH